MRTIERSSRFVAAALGLAAALFSGGAIAACEGTAVEHDQAECLTMTKEISTGVPVITSVTLVNTCSTLGSLVVNVDPDRGLDSKLTVATRGFTSISGGVRSVECCRDEGDLCDKADVVNVASCNAQFEASDAADDCTVNKSQTTTVDDEKCNFYVSCPRFTTWEEFDYLDMDDLVYCDRTENSHARLDTSCD